MCSCQQHSSAATGATSAPEHAINFRVEDMTCGHCAGTIKKAIEDQLPGTAVTADPASKLVSVVGTADFSAIKSIVTGAGYTPNPDRVG
ncbi:MAG: heavy-metal-associated domain-containing protein [Bosea sp.]|jgi:copper chaperone|uniref:heavy-metal-associated domain-containing protein n=1 Tax=Bosea sp. (in: a-proteobacteria) TaxID=1871050 RepID=UPI00238D5C26|nr:heavy-metal-associated domain-containing protein [Bosea sp. (in: a-proteobacteria)]MCP4738671.1 heavy-metal-associated domain-containing protein [Bosea sp. (in: a-proteobacteria)]